MGKRRAARGPEKRIPEKGAWWYKRFALAVELRKSPSVLAARQVSTKVEDNDIENNRVQLQWSRCCGADSILRITAEV